MEVPADVPSNPLQLKKGTSRGSPVAILESTMALYDPSPKLIDSIDKDRFVRVYDAPPAIAAGRMEFGANNILISISGKMLVSKNLCKQRRFVNPRRYL